MSQKLLYAHILLDRSGSMESIQDKTIDAFNEYVGGLAKDPDVDAAVSLSLFDAPAVALDFDLVHDGVKATALPKLTKETYRPRGMTPLNDAIGQTVQRMDKEIHRPGETIVLVILTDGLENASKEFSASAIKALLERKQKDDKWLVIYLGANQDAFQEGGARGIAKSGSMNFQPSSIQASMLAAGRATRSYYATGNMAEAAFTDEERLAAVGKKAKEPAPTA